MEKLSGQIKGQIGSYDIHPDILISVRGVHASSLKGGPFITA